MAIINPLDLETLFVDNIAGSITIFFFLALIVIAFFASKWRMTNMVFLSMVGLFLIFMAGFGFMTLLVTVIVVGGFVIAWTLSRMTKT